MTIDDEKDYIMRIIKDMVRMLFSLLFGRRYSAVEVENVNKYEVEGKSLDELLDMADAGQINEAENILLEGMKSLVREAGYPDISNSELY